eukprot:3991113-Alexandrium_andersonii.AAC.1
MNKVSLFTLPEFVRLLELPGVSKVDFDQCRFGAQTAKPTRIMYAGIDLSALDLKCDRPRAEMTHRGRWG